METFVDYVANYGKTLKPGIKYLETEMSYLFMYTDKIPSGMMIAQQNFKYPAANQATQYPGGVFEIACFTIPQARNQGISRQLFDAGEEWLQARVNRLGKGLFISRISIPELLPETQSLFLRVNKMFMKREYKEIEDYCFEKEFAPVIMKR